MKRAVTLCAVLILILCVALPAYAQTPTSTATATATATATPWPTMRFTVGNGVTQIIGPNGTKYQVSSGVVDLPIGTWYYPLIANGTLAKQQSTLTAGNLVITNTAIIPTISGNVNITGTLTTGTTVSNGTIAQDTTVTGVVTATGFVGPLTGNVTGNLSGATVAATGAVSATGNIGVGAFIVQTKQGTVTVTAGGVITPTGTYQPITAGGAVSTTLVTTKTLSTGTVVRLINVGSQAITLGNYKTANYDTMRLNADLVLGQYDSAALQFDGTYWVQISPVMDVTP